MASKIPLEHLPRIMRGGRAYDRAEAHCRAARPLHETRHYAISRGDRITALAAYALVAMILGYFSAQMLRGAF